MYLPPYSIGLLTYPISLGLDHLIGTPALKPYMHGYFISLKLYDAARVIANPFIYAEHREKLVRAKLDKLAESRIRTQKGKLPKVNRALAERIMKAEEKEARKKKRKRDEDQNEAMKEEKGGLLVDPRFKSVFEDPEFEVDEASREYALMHPSQAEASTRKRRAKTAVEAEEESELDSSEDALAGGDSSEEDDEEKSGDEDSSEDGEPLDCLLVIRFTEIAKDMAAVNLCNNRPPQTPQIRKIPHNIPRMVSASASLGATGKANDDKFASFGQRRQRPSGTHHTTRKGALQKAEDGGFALSWIPSKTKGDSGKPVRVGVNSKIRRPGIEYLGAGLEKGVEQFKNLSETERKGRSERRKNVRSGSKNVFRKL
jgi:ribosome biogenesis protein ENP2